MSEVALKKYPRRLIEVDLQISRISAHARREKSLRKGNISSLHIWWARRPLGACRAILCALLWPDPSDTNCPTSFQVVARREMQQWAERNLQLASGESQNKLIKISKNPRLLDDANYLQRILLDFISDFAQWENSSRKEFLEVSRALTTSASIALENNADGGTHILDPFAGGGAIPLEAARLGAFCFASDLNPIPVLLNRLLLQYLPKYGDQLAKALADVSESVESEFQERLRQLFPLGEDGSTPIAYIWARTVLSDDPSGGETPVEIPLIRSMMLKAKGGELRALRWKRDKGGKILTQTICVKYADGTEVQVRRPLLEIFEPTKASEVESGTSAGGAATCPISGYTTTVERVREQLSKRSGGSRDSRLLAVVSISKKSPGRSYRIAIEQDNQAVEKANKLLKELISSSEVELPSVPDEPLNHLRGFFNIVLYGMTKWGDVFTSRQLVTLLVISDVVRNVTSTRLDGYEPKLREAVRTCLSLALGKMADRNSALCRWINQNENIGYTFGRQALPMMWDFVEISPIDSSGGWRGVIEDIAQTIQSQSVGQTMGQAEQASATEHPLPNDSVDCVFTDPPYYAAIPYADLSDFFYVWLKRNLSDVFPDLFQERLSPKENEIVALSHRAAMYRNKNNEWFEHKMALACAEARRIVKPAGIGCFVFANKEVRGWEAMLNALISSGWVITASWPIDTERPGRLRALNSAALASSVHLVCRPREGIDGQLITDYVGEWRDVLNGLSARIHDWMKRLISEQVVGADAIFACLGPALEIFSQYSHVERSDGSRVELSEYLENVWSVIAREALQSIFSEADTIGLEDDGRLTCVWYWTLSAGKPNVEVDQEDDSDEEADNKSVPGGYTLEFDAARKIAQGLGVDLERATSLVEIAGDKARLLSVGERASFLFTKRKTSDGAEESIKSSTSKRKKKTEQMSLFQSLSTEPDALTSQEEPEVHTIGEGNVATVLGRLHQSMILFGAGRGESLRRFLVDEGNGKDPQIWKLAQALSALYPAGSDEKRWVDGVLARKKGLGL